MVRDRLRGGGRQGQIDKWEAARAADKSSCWRGRQCSSTRRSGMPCDAALIVAAAAAAPIIAAALIVAAAAAAAPIIAAALIVAAAAAAAPIIAAALIVAAAALIVTVADEKESNINSDESSSSSSSSSSDAATPATAIRRDAAVIPAPQHSAAQPSRRSLGTGALQDATRCSAARRSRRLPVAAAQRSVLIYHVRRALHRA